MGEVFAYPSILLYWLWGLLCLVGVKSAWSGMGIDGSVSLYGDINLEA